MSLPSNKSWICYILTIACASSTASAGESCYDKLITNCIELDAEAKAVFNASKAKSGSTPRDVATVGGQATAAGDAGKKAALLCLRRANECEKACEKEKETDKDVISRCQEAVRVQAKTMEDQAFGFSITGEDIQKWLPWVLGAGAIGTGIAMAARGSGSPAQQPLQNPAPQATAEPTGALQNDGSLKCDRGDSHTYPDCNNYLVGACIAYVSPAPQVGSGTLSPVTPVTPATGTVLQTAGGASTQIDCASFTSRYCSATKTEAQHLGNHLPSGQVTQVNLGGSGEGFSSDYCKTFWCKTHSDCSLCKILASGACTSNPSACLGMNIAADNTCQGYPTDTTGATGSLATIGTTPASVTTGGTIVTSSLNQQLMAAGGVIGQREPSAVGGHRGPASDVDGLSGSNLFMTSSLVYKQRCETGRMNCP